MSAIVVLKAYFNKKTGALKAYRVRDDAGRKFRIGSRGWTPGTQRMKAWMDFGVQLVKDRTAKAIGSNDMPMPKLQGRSWAVFENGKFKERKRSGYREVKIKLGLNPIRDLRGPGDGGHMLDDLSTRYADERKSHADITRQLSRIKARQNEARAPWFQWSDSDQRKLWEVGQQIGTVFAAEARAAITGDPVPASIAPSGGPSMGNPQWMDPLGLKNKFKSIAAA